jgi:hypothetical protein
VFFACVERGRSPTHQEIFLNWILPFQLLNAGKFTGLPIFAHEASTHAKFFDSAGSLSNSHVTLPGVWPSLPVHEVGTRKLVISELNSSPALSPVNKTSPKADVLPQPPHDSGLT